MDCMVYSLFSYMNDCVLCTSYCVMIMLAYIFILCSLPGYYCDKCGIAVHPEKVLSSEKMLEYNVTHSFMGIPARLMHMNRCNYM